MVWVWCFKYKYYGVKVVRCVVALVVCYFYSGVSSRLRVMERFLIFGGVLIRLVFNVKDNKRKRKLDL